MPTLRSVSNWRARISSVNVIGFSIGRKTMGRGIRGRSRDRSASLRSDAKPHSSRGRYQFQYSYTNARDLILPALPLIIVIGTVIGAVLANIAGEQEYMRLSANIGSLLSNTSQIELLRREIFFEAVIKYAKIPLVIWFAAFIPPGAIISIALLFAKGMGIGFTTGLFTRCYGTAGMLYSVILYFAQNFFIIPAYIYLSYESLNFAADSLRLPKGNQKHNGFTKNTLMAFLSAIGNSASAEGNRLAEYSFSLIVSFSCAVLAALIEAYCIPRLLAAFV